MNEGFTQYQRTQIAELRPYIPGETLDPRVSISPADIEGGSPRPDDMIARNPKNHADQWLVAADYFAANFEPLADSAPYWPSLWSAQGKQARAAFDRSLAQYMEAVHEEAFCVDHSMWVWSAAVLEDLKEWLPDWLHGELEELGLDEDGVALGNKLDDQLEKRLAREASEKNRERVARDWDAGTVQSTRPLPRCPSCAAQSRKEGGT